MARRVSAGTTPGIRYEEGTADALPLPDGWADVVFCQQGLQFFPDPAAALAELHRVCLPGGRPAVSTCRSLAHQPGYRVLVDVLVDVLARRVAAAALVADLGTALAPHTDDDGVVFPFETAVLTAHR